MWRLFKTVKITIELSPQTADLAKRALDLWEGKQLEGIAAATAELTEDSNKLKKALEESK